jgi:hypothetical protein
MEIKENGLITEITKIKDGAFKLNDDIIVDFNTLDETGNIQIDYDDVRYGEDEANAIVDEFLVAMYKGLKEKI